MKLNLNGRSYWIQRAGSEWIWHQIPFPQMMSGGFRTEKAAIKDLRRYGRAVMHDPAKIKSV